MYPRGFCIHELAAMMNSADRHAPSGIIQAVNRCTRFGRASQPNHHTPRNTASRKNAARPSMASGAPKTSPTNREYTDQSRPNWNSWTRPVTTPTLMLISRSLPKNLVSRRMSGSPDRYQRVCSTATRIDRPIVIGTKKKW